MARVDITPDGPVRLTGYASRKTESEGVAERLWAKALAIGGDAGDGAGRADDGRELRRAAGPDGRGGRPPEGQGRPEAAAAGGLLDAHARRAVAAGVRPGVGGCGPARRSTVPTWSSTSGELADKMEQAALAALAARQPARLAWGQGAVRFAMNRRPINEQGLCPGLGVNPGGPVDHSLPLLCATDAQGKILAIVVNYACHCTTLGGDFNRIHGDWAGMAQQYIEAEHPGATALVCDRLRGRRQSRAAGQAGNDRPHGRAVADEVNRLLRGKLTPLGPPADRPAPAVPASRWTSCPRGRSSRPRVAAGQQPKATAEAKRLRRPGRGAAGRPGSAAGPCPRASTTA